MQLIQNPRTLIYERRDSEAIAFAGGDAQEGSSLTGIRHAKADTQEGDNYKALPAFTFPPQPFDSASYSSAPLTDVIRTQVFHEEEGSRCRGILLEYRNGSKRALGQCKVGVDQNQECTEPACICYRNSFGNGQQSVQVHISKERSHRHEEEDWICCNMRGVLEFWFSNKKEKIQWQQ